METSSGPEELEDLVH